MAHKTVTVILYGADRQLWTGPAARMFVRDLNSGELRLLADKPITHSTVEITLQNLPFDTGQIYGLSIEADGHRTASQLIRRLSFLREVNGRRIERDHTIFRIMMVPEQAVSSDLGTGYGRLVARGSFLVHFWTVDRYQGLSVPEKMAFLNLEAKLRETYIGHDSLSSFVSGMRAADSDRLFLLVRSDLKALVERSADFASAGGHGVPENHPDFPACPDSWKHTAFEFGNIQLSFSATTEPAGTPVQNCFSLDTDIDLERGLLHAGEWLDNNVLHPGQKTDQTFVYPLLFAQGILPDYTLKQAT